MARIDRALLDTGTFAFAVQVGTRFDDLDVQGHVNNVATAVLFEEGRVMFNRHAGLPGMLVGGLRVMVASLQIEFAAEIHHPDPVEIRSGTLAIGRSSITIGSVAHQNGRSVAYAQVTLVMANADGPTPVPDAVRESYERLRLVAA